MERGNKGVVRQVVLKVEHELDMQKCRSMGNIEDEKDIK